MRCPTLDVACRPARLTSAIARTCCVRLVAVQASAMVALGGDTGSESRRKVAKLDKRGST